MRFVAPYLGALYFFCLPAAGQVETIPARLMFADALRIAETANPEFLAIQSAVEVAQADAIEAGSLPNPEIAVEGEEYAIFRSNLPSFWNGQALVVRVEQEIETAGRRDHRIRAADVGISVARAEIANARRELQLEVGRAYFQLALAQANQLTAIATLDEIQQVIDLTEARFNAGEVAGTDLRRLQVERLHYVDQTYATELAVSNSRVALLELLGAVDLTQSFDAADPLEAPPLRDPDGRLIATEDGVLVDLGALRAAAAGNRPDLLAARYTRERTEAEIELQQALGNPNLTVGWGYRRDFGTHAMDFELSIPLPLFGSLNPGGVERADAERRRAMALETAVAAAADGELQRAVAAVDINVQRVRYVEEEYVRSAEELLERVQASYDLGETALIDFLDVQREFLVTQQVRNQALYELRISLIELAAALGVPATGQP